MRTSQHQSPEYIPGIMTRSSRKENVPYTGSPNHMASTMVTFSTISPSSPTNSRLLQTQWVNTTQTPINLKPTSPKILAQTVNPREHHIIELGGSKEKNRISRDKAVSNCSADTQGNQISSVKVNVNKITVLENRVKELHMEKQQLAIDLHKKIKVLELQNQRLNTIVKESEGPKTFATQNNEEFNLEDELSHQINVNLELREQLQALKTQLTASQETTGKQKTRIATLEDEKAEIQLQLGQIQDSTHDQIEALKLQVQTLETSLKKKDQTFQVILEEKEKRILDLQEETFSLGNRLSEKQKQNSSILQEKSSAKEQIDSLRSKVSELQKPVECKKCKDMMHTVFRLNAQLNKK